MGKRMTGMFGRNSFIDGIKSALAAAGCDMDTFRSWQKMYEKVNRKKKDEEEKYVRCRNMIMCVKADGEKMEEMLTADTPLDSGEFARLLKELKQLQGSFDHEFLVSREDHEFHSTYDTIIRLGIKALETPEQSLLLQSEIENLLELLKENLEKKKPDILALTFYYQVGTEKNLASMSPADKLARIERAYEKEFKGPVIRLLAEGIRRADDIIAQSEQKADRASSRKAEAVEILAGKSPDEIFDRMMKEE